MLWIAGRTYYSRGVGPGYSLFGLTIDELTDGRYGTDAPAPTPRPVEDGACEACGALTSGNELQASEHENLCGLCEALRWRGQVARAEHQTERMIETW